MNITDYLPVKSKANTNTEVRDFLNGTMGEFLEKYNHVISEIRDNHILTATDTVLDRIGEDYNVKRWINETDTHYRDRIVSFTKKQLTIDDLINNTECIFLSFKDDITPSENMLLSDNPIFYIPNQHKAFFVICTNKEEDFLNSKFNHVFKRVIL